VIGEGENDVSFLKGMSQMLHRSIPGMPNLRQLEHDHLIVFLPSCGSNLKAWVLRLATLNKREFYLFDREQEPETSGRRQTVDLAALRPSPRSEPSRTTCIHAQSRKLVASTLFSTTTRTLPTCWP
jgi:hypothetical protein